MTEQSLSGLLRRIFTDDGVRGAIDLTKLIAENEDTAKNPDDWVCDIARTVRTFVDAWKKDAKTPLPVWVVYIYRWKLDCAPD